MFSYFSSKAYRYLQKKKEKKFWNFCLKILFFFILKKETLKLTETLKDAWKLNETQKPVFDTHGHENHFGCRIIN